MTFVLSTELINTYGFKVLLSGIELGRFNANPVMLWNHVRASRYDKDGILVIGRWENIRMEDGQLMADAVFDEEDEFALKIKGKVDRGFIKACSIGIRILEMVAEGDPENPTYVVTKCELLEASITDIPANADSVILYDADKNVINLNEVSLSALTTTSNKVQKSNSTMEELTAIAQFLGLSADANLNQVMTAITALKGKDNEIAQLKAQIQGFEAEKEAQRSAEIQALLTEASKDGRINEKDRSNWELNLNTNFEATKSLLASMKPVVKLSDLTKVKLDEDGGDGVKYKGKTFKEWQRTKGGDQVLGELKVNDFQTFSALFKASFGKDYVVYQSAK